MIRRTLLALAGALLLAACGAGDAPQAAAPSNKVVFSILSTENSQNLRSLWAPFLADMEAETGLEIEPYFAGNYTLLIEAMKAGQVQVGWFSNNSGLQAVRRAGGEVFARSTDPSGVDGYKAVVIVPAASTTTLDDLLRCDRRLTFGLGDVESTSGTLAPVTYLFAPRNIDPQTCFRQVRRANHEANLVAVAGGTVDAATNNSTNIKRMARQRPEIARRVRVIWESPTIPEDPIVWRRDLDPAIKAKIREFFLTYGSEGGEEGARRTAILNALDFGGFRAADDTHLIPVREMEATEEVLAAKNAGDAARQATAQAALDAVRRERAALPTS